MVDNDSSLLVMVENGWLGLANHGDLHHGSPMQSMLRLVEMLQLDVWICLMVEYGSNMIFNHQPG